MPHGPPRPRRLSRPPAPRHPARQRPRADLLLGRRLCASIATCSPSTAAAAGVEVWAWVLMPNHVHLILVPARCRRAAPRARAGPSQLCGPVHMRQQKRAGISGRAGSAASRWTRRISGAALRYVALNPVRARLCERAADWPWSSVHAHLGARTTASRNAHRCRRRYPDFAALDRAGEDEALSETPAPGRNDRPPARQTRHSSRRLERKSGRPLKPAKRGPKPSGGGS